MNYQTRYNLRTKKKTIIIIISSRIEIFIKYIEKYKGIERIKIEYSIQKALKRIRRLKKHDIRHDKILERSDLISIITSILR